MLLRRFSKAGTHRVALIAIAAVLVLAIIGGVAYALWPRGGSAPRQTGHLALGQTSPASSPATDSPGSSNPGTTASPPPLKTSPRLPAQLPPQARPLRVPILMYHYVDASLNPTDPYAAGNTVSPEQFAAQMDYLAANGYHPVTLEQVYIAMAGLGSLPAKPVVLTFDDGWKDQYTVVFPILRSHDFVATFFVITGHVGLGHERSMSWDELREMEDQGMAIESHTVHHLDLRTLTPVRLQSELTESRDNIWAMLGELPMAFAYPSGAYNQRVIAAVRAAGYRIAVTTHFGKILDPSHTFEWPRVRVTPYESLAVFARELA